jgi:hypothetical protein
MRRVMIFPAIRRPAGADFSKIAAWHYLTESMLLPRRARQCILIIII